MTTVKICGLTNLEDARWAWRCGADLLGFILVRASPRYIPPGEVMRIAGVLRAEGCHCRLVGVFADEPVEVVRGVVSAQGLHLAQLHGNETPAYAAQLGIPYIVVRRVGDALPWDELAGYAPWAYLFDSYDAQRRGGTGRTWNWELLRDAAHLGKRLIIAGGLTPDNVGQAIRRARPWGVDVSSGVEATPGRKDADKVARFIQSVREAEL